MRKAVFISRTGALLAGLKEARREGFKNEVIIQRVRHYPVYKRGQLVGYEAWVPHGTGARPILEDVA